MIQNEPIFRVLFYSVSRLFFLSRPRARVVEKLEEVSCDASHASSFICLSLLTLKEKGNHYAYPQFW